MQNELKLGARALHATNPRSLPHHHTKSPMYKVGSQMPWVNCSVEFQSARPEASGLADWFPTRPGHRLGHSEHNDKQSRNSLLTSRVPGALDSRLWALAAGHGYWLGPGDGHAVGLRHGCGSSTLVGSRTKFWLLHQNPHELKSPNSAGGHRTRVDP